MSSDTSGKPTITGLVLTYNGERLLGKCLESLAFCDAVIVVDSFSSDATESIAREHGATKSPGSVFQDHGKCFIVQ